MLLQQLLTSMPAVQGDWGTQFGMLIQQIAETREGGLEAISDADVSDLEVLYKASKQHFDADPDFKKRAQMAVKSLQDGDPLFLKVMSRQWACYLACAARYSELVTCPAEQAKIAATGKL